MFHTLRPRALFSYPRQVQHEGGRHSLLREAGLACEQRRALLNQFCKVKRADKENGSLSLYQYFVQEPARAKFVPKSYAAN